MAEDHIEIEDLGRVKRLATALGYRLRLEVLLAHANDGPASATTLAFEKGLGPLQNVSYHQIKLRDLDVLKRVDTRRRRGAEEHLYDLTDFGREVLDTAVVFGTKPE